MIEAGFKYLVQNKLYIWKRRKAKKTTTQQAEDIIKQKNEILNQDGVKLTGNKLRDLAWSLDVLDLKKENGN